MRVTQTLELVDAETIHRGIMVALYLDPKTAASLAIKGGEPPEQLHITLAYIGKTDTVDDALEDDVIQLLEKLATTQGPLTGEIAGRGLFNDGGDGAPFILLPDLPGLPAFRDALVQGLAAVGAPPNEKHGFTPHITLRYLQEGDEIEAGAGESTPLRFDAVSLSWGDNRTDVPFGSSTQELGVDDLLELLAKTLELGDTEGHDFHGNQWTGSFLGEIKAHDLAMEVRNDPRFAPGAEGGGMSVSTWYTDTKTQEKYLLKEASRGEALPELMAQKILDKTDLPHMEVRRASPMEEDGSGLVLIQHLNQNPDVVPGSFHVGRADAPVASADPVQADRWIRDRIGMDLFDNLIRNDDRHTGNYGTVKDPETGLTRLALIDNSSGLSANYNTDDEGRWGVDAARAAGEKVGDIIPFTGDDVLAAGADANLSYDQLHATVSSAFDDYIGQFEAGVQNATSSGAAKSYGTDYLSPSKDTFDRSSGNLASQLDWLKGQRESYIDEVMPAEATYESERRMSAAMGLHS